MPMPEKLAELAAATCLPVFEQPEHSEWLLRLEP
jgi:hypothetical protein